MKGRSGPLDCRLGEPQKIDALSVLIPVYNSQSTIGRLVDAVIAKLAASFQRLGLPEGQRRLRRDMRLLYHSSHQGAAAEPFCGEAGR